MKTARPGPFTVAVAGGGAAGFFGAIACAERRPSARVILLEKSPELLAKVTISGGGRCNVTHACYDPQRLAEHFPRGGRELIGPFHRWQPRDTMQWFETRGVPLKTEEDGRVFPASDRAASITDCLIAEGRSRGVEIRSGCGLRSARKNGTQFLIELSTGERLLADCLLLATGGNVASAGHAIAASLGHAIEPPVPSLFTFHIRDPRIEGLAGITVSRVRAVAGGERQEGALLVTHSGLSGPAILRLSAWGARVLHDADYLFDLEIDWVPDLDGSAIREELASAREGDAARLVVASPKFGLPARLWKSLVVHEGVREETRWSGLSARTVETMAQHLKRGVFRVTGRSLNKEEFVTCGGVRLAEVNFQTMESRRCPGLYLAGEVLDIDGVTGGFNLQAAWTTGWIAGTAIGQE